MNSLNIGTTFASQMMTSVMQSTNDSKMQSATAISPEKMASIDKTSKEFESMFMSQMLNLIFENIPTDPVMGGGNAEKMYQSLLVDEYGKAMTAKGGLGISAQIKASMLKMQEVGQHSSQMKTN